MTNIAKILAQAKAYHAAGDLRIAAPLYRRVLEVDSANMEAQYLLGAACDGLGEVNEAIGRLTQAVRLQPDHADAHNQLGVVLAKQGKLAEAILNFQQAWRLRPDSAEISKNLRNARAAKDNVQGNELIAQGKVEEAAICFQRARGLNSEFAVAHTEMGATLVTQHKLDEAASCFRLALDLNPDYADAHNNLGAVLVEQTKLDEAVACFCRALELNPNFAEARNNLGIVLEKQHKFDDAAACFRLALELKPNFADAHNNLGDVLLWQAKVDDAVACFRRALVLNPNSAQVHYNHGVALLLRGDYTEGWQEYEWRLKIKGRNETPLKQPCWTGSPLNGKTIVLRTEQGLGDTLQFIRYAELVKQQGGIVTVECPRVLTRVVARCPGVDSVIVAGQPLPKFDVHVTLLSLPGIFRTSLESIPAKVPYILPDKELIHKWKHELGHEADFRIGIAWQGNPANRKDRVRSIPLAQFAGIARTPGTHVYSLQMGSGHEQLAEFGQRLAITDLSAQIHDFQDTAAIMCNLDLVVTCESAPAHLAGALGVPVWVALDFASDWRWMLEREDSLWYPTMRLFRQSRAGDWEEVFRRILGKLATIVSVNKCSRTVSA